MSRAFDGHADSDFDGKFDLLEEEHFRFFVTVGDDGCDLLVRAPGYCDWRETVLCGKTHVEWEFYNVLLVAAGSCGKPHRSDVALVCTPDSDHN